MSDDKPVIKEVLLDAPVTRVWKAITDKNEMKKWYFDLTEFRTEVGFKFNFMAGDDKKKYLHLCEVTEVKENEKLKYSWRYDGYPGISFVTFELFEEGEKTRLKLTHEGIDSFGPYPELAKENFDAGWEAIIKKNLKEFIEK